MIIRAAAIALALVIARPNALNAAPRQLVFSSSSENDLLEIEPGAPQRASWSRGVVSSNAFGAALPRLRILGLHDCRFLTITLPSSVTPHLVLARVAGFDSAVYGLPETDVHPILFEHPERKTYWLGRLRSAVS